MLLSRISEVMEIERIFNLQKQARFAVASTSCGVRKSRLRRLQQYLLEHVEDACEATRKDFGKPEAETIIGELLVLQSELSYAIRNLERWMAPHHQRTSLATIGTTSWIQYEAKGCALIMAPWNYPINLALKPLVSAVAAGCTAIIKPSEMTPHSANFVADVIRNVFPPEEVAVVQGDAQIAERLLALPFEHIFFTGSPGVGKIVMKAAAAHLSSVTLELGGKSPSIIDETADIPETARKIAWGKFFNNGQTCIAPDYVLVQDAVHDRFVNELAKALDNMYGTAQQHTASYGRIVNERHYDRLYAVLSQTLKAGAMLRYGGKVDRQERFFSPTVLTGVTGSMAIMQEEIFGPILPVVRFGSLEDAIAIVRSHEKPLALYVHSRSQKHIDRLLKETSAGNALVNEVLTQFGNHQIPFGGVNNSGIGKSNGFYGFQEFSNAKGIMRRRFGTMRFLHPPYGPGLIEWLKMGLKWL